MLEEARARVVDVETGAEPRPTPTPVEAPPTRVRISKGRAVARPGRKSPQPKAPAPEVPPPEPAPTRIVGPATKADRLGDRELLWLEDQPGHTVAETSDGSTDSAAWRRGLRG